MIPKQGRVRTRILVPIVVVVAVLIAAGIGGTYQLESQSIVNQFRDKQAGVQELFANELDEEARLLNSQAHFLMEDTTLQAAYLARDREQLLEAVTPTYETVNQNFRVTHLYFIDTEREVFLRAHNPTKFGDYIGRFTLEGAVTTAQQSHGIELGRFGTFTLRTVNPWMIDGELVGYVELGMEIEHITPRLQSILGTELVFLIDKSFLEQANWEEGLAFLGKEGDWNAFSDTVVIDQSLSIPTTDIADHANAASSDDLFRVSLEDSTYQGGDAPLIDAGGRQVGKIIVLDDITTAQANLQNTLLVLAALGLILGGLLFAGFYVYSGRIEKRLEAEQELLVMRVRMQEQKLLEGIIHNAGSAIYVKDEAGRFLLANQQYLDLVKQPSVKGKTTHDIQPKKLADQIHNIDSAVLRSKASQQTELSVSQNGHVRYYLDTKFPIQDEMGSVYAMCSIATDITDRKHAEQERETLIKDLHIANRLAKENARLKGEFLATMSHELRTPMNAIEGFTSIVLSGMGGAEYNAKTERYLKKVNANSQRLLSLINAFLDLSRIESGRVDLANMAMSPAKMAQVWRDEIGVLADNKQLDFEVNIDPALPETIYGDEESVTKIALNLLGNAIKFTEEGKVALSVRCGSEQDWVIEVADTGIGIPPHAREYIFEEFRQVDQTSKRKYGGTGLGLAIVQRLARLMGGKVSLTSEVGEGSTFTVTLPIHIVEKELV